MAEMVGYSQRDPDAMFSRTRSTAEQKDAGMFERFKSSVWNPSLDSDVLEGEHQRLAFPQTRRRFRIGLVYIIVSTLAWCVFFAANQADSWIAFTSGCLVLTLYGSLVLAFTFTKLYKRYVILASILFTVCLCVFCLLSFVTDEAAMSEVGLFTGCVEILLLMYTVIPLRLYGCFLIGGVFSLAFEVFSALEARGDEWSSGGDLAQYVAGRALLQLCVHLLGAHLFYMAQMRERLTFLKVAQSILLRRDLEREKDLKKKMINSLMPEQVAREVMDARGGDGARADDDSVRQSPTHRGSKVSTSGTPKMTFRNFHMSQMENTSILFADIVGFTKMSSNKTAEHLVSLLNDLFGRFDVICDKSGCEKISTLGDCYYCVSGCPQPRPDHAECCVEMGMGMVVAIEEFDRDHNEEVGMRVGVHTGTVLCGLVGTRRFKFDVWSHDVTIANLMESEGEPGLVHVSEPTYELVKHKYEMEAGESIKGTLQVPLVCLKYGRVHNFICVRADVTGVKTGALVDRYPAFAATDRILRQRDAEVQHQARAGRGRSVASLLVVREFAISGHRVCL